MNDKDIEKSGAMDAPAAPARAHNAGDGAVGATDTRRQIKSGQNSADLQPMSLRD